MLIKTKLKGSKGHISVQIDQNWPKWHHFDHKMTSYVKFGCAMTKKYSKLSTLTIETLYIYFLLVKTKLKGSKGHISVQIGQKQS